MVFGRRGRERVVNDLHKLWDHYKDIVSKQHHLRTELDKLYRLEKRESELKDHLARLNNMNDLNDIARGARKILDQELHFVVLIERNIDRCMRHLKDQKALIRRIRRDLRR